MKKVKNSELLLSYIREGRTMTSREKLALITQLSIPSILAQISATVMFFIDAGRAGLCCEHGILRAGGPLYRSQRLRGCPQGVAPVDRLLSHLESDHLGDSSRHRAIPAVLVGWIC